MKNNALFIVGLIALSMLVGCQSSVSDSSAGDGSGVVIPPAEPSTGLAKVLNQRATVLIEGGDYDGALVLLKEAVVADANYAPVHNQLGLVYFAKEDWPEGAKHFRRVIQLTPQLPTAYNNLGLIHERLGDLSAAIDQYRRAYALDSAEAQYLGNLARAMHRRRDGAEALRPLLVELVKIERRDAWLAWAQEQLALLPEVD